MAPAGTTRTTISVPSDLKKRMDKVKEPVNWSAVACLAFESKLGEIAARKEKKAMEDVIQRLRASKQKSDSELHIRGREAGIDWAKNNASFSELSKLHDYSEHMELYELAHDYQQAFSPYEYVYFLIHPEDHGDRAACNDFWERTVGEGEGVKVNLIEPEFLLGFCCGALEVFQEVQEKL